MPLIAGYTLVWRREGIGVIRLKVAIVGVGKMGTLLAHRIPGSVRKVIIGRRKGEATALADEVGGIASDQFSAVRGARVIFLAVGRTAAAQIAAEIEPFAEPTTLLVNMATDLPTSDLQAEYPNLRFAAAKVIGHADEMRRGSPGIVLLDRIDSEGEATLRSLLDGLGPVTVGTEAQALAANTAVIEVMAAAQRELHERLSAIGLATELRQAAIGTTGPGVIRALALGEVGPFARSVLARLQSHGSET
jgi:pyrroline-5-carboxylate reductase